MSHTLRCLLLCLPLAACGGKSDSAKETPVINPADLSAQFIEPGPLRKASATELETLLKNGFYATASTSDLAKAKVEVAILANNFNVLLGTNFSGTNVQVQGVDEADSVKYDGSYIYSATLEYRGYTNAILNADALQATSAPPTTKPSIAILKTDSLNATTTPISRIEIDVKDHIDSPKLYLVGKEDSTSGLVVINQQEVSPVFPMLESRTSWTSIGYFDSSVDIRLYDVRVPSQPSEAWSIKIDGRLLSTRKIDNKLYVVSQFIPTIPSLKYNATNENAFDDNQTIISQTSLSQLLPKYSIKGGAELPLVKDSRCLIANSTRLNHWNLNVVNLTTIDLATQQMLHSECIVADVQGIYASQANVYLGGSSYSAWNNWQNFTVIHKFSLAENGASYQASGAVEGTLGWNQPAYRMDEHNDFLRVVTTDRSSSGEPKHLLSVLQKVTGRSDLAVVAQLPNSKNPEPIGKPNEDIYSVRFDRSKAYVVTFRRTDPLYVIDIANPLNPKIAGELEVPGFSTYLHPIGDKYLFSLGNETDANGRTTGVKASLFDIGDMTKPRLINAKVFGSTYSWSTALYDTHALSFLQVNANQLRVTFPVTEMVPSSSTSLFSQTKSSLKLIEINRLADSSDSALLEYAGEVIQAPETYDFYSYGVERGILHDKAVFYLRGGYVASSLWKPMNAFSNPEMSLK